MINFIRYILAIPCALVLAIICPTIIIKLQTGDVVGHEIQKELIFFWVFVMISSSILPFYKTLISCIGCLFLSGLSIISGFYLLNIGDEVEIAPLFVDAIALFISICRICQDKGNYRDAEW